MNAKYLRNRIALRALPEYAHISDEELSREYKPVDELKPESLDLDDIQKVLYAPDPKTGTPRSDLAVIMSKNNHAEVADYIQRSLMGSLPSVAGSDDPDLVLDSIKDKRESLVQYAERLRELSNKA